MLCASSSPPLIAAHFTGHAEGPGSRPARSAGARGTCRAQSPLRCASWPASSQQDGCSGRRQASGDSSSSVRRRPGLRRSRRSRCARGPVRWSCRSRADDFHRRCGCQLCDRHAAGQGASFRRLLRRTGGTDGGCALHVDRTIPPSLRPYCLLCRLCRRPWTRAATCCSCQRPAASWAAARQRWVLALLLFGPALRQLSPTPQAAVLR